MEVKQNNAVNPETSTVPLFLLFFENEVKHEVKMSFSSQKKKRKKKGKPSQDCSIVANLF